MRLPFVEASVSERLPQPVFDPKLSLEHSLKSSEVLQQFSVEFYSELAYVSISFKFEKVPADNGSTQYDVKNTWCQINSLRGDIAPKPVLEE
jgi:hypothetical protein